MLAAWLLLASPAVGAPRWLAPVTLSAPGQMVGMPQVAMDPAGDVIAVWDRWDGSKWIVQAAIRPPGGSFGQPVNLSASGQDARNERVAVDRAGNAVAVWQRFDGSHWAVQAAVRPAGGTFGQARDLSVPGQDAELPQVAVGEGGDAVAVWKRMNGANWIVQAAIRPAEGSFGQPVDLSAIYYHADEPQVAVDQAGDAVAVWRREAHWEYGTYSIVQAAVRPAGGSFGQPVDLSAIPGQDALQPQVAIGQRGDAVVLWRRSYWMPDRVHWILQAAVRSAGGSFRQAGDLTTYDRDAAEPHVAVDQAGGAVAVWLRAGGAHWVVQAAARPPGGSFSKPVDLLAAGQYGDEPALAVDQAGDAVAVWRHFVTGAGVQAASRPAGGSFGPPVDVSSAGQWGQLPQVALDQAGDAVAVWSATPGVQAAGYDFAGPRLTALSIPTTGTAGRALSFRVAPVDVWSGVTSVIWSFGDGRQAAGTTVSHTYAQAGSYRVSVTGTDRQGNSTSANALLRINPAALPVLSALDISPHTFALTGRLVNGRCVAPTAKNRNHRRCTRQIKLHITYRLNMPADLIFTVKRRAPGRLVNGRCVKPTAKNTARRSCTRWQALTGKLIRTGKQGTNSFTWLGRIGGHKLPPGSYRLTATPTTGRHTGKALSTSFTIRG